MGGEDYVVAFDVAIQPDKNRYKTHRVINEISLTKLENSTLPYTDSGRNQASSLITNSISENGENINTSGTERGMTILKRQ